MVLSTVAATLVACGPAGRPPTMGPVSDQMVGVGEDVVIVLTATDPDGDDLFYSYASDLPDARTRVTLDRLPSGSAELRWTPAAGDVGVWYFDLSATDGRFTATATVRIEVTAATGKLGVPIFRQPLGTGTTLDLSDDDDGCAMVPILIEDTDDTTVDIAQEEPLISGATFETTGPLSAQWIFCPTAEQIATADRFTLTLSAADGDHEKTIKHFLIVVRKPEKTGCDGMAPVIMHTPEDESTDAGLTIAATITDDRGLANEPLLYYTTTPPSTPPDLGAMNPVDMLLIEGDLWAADVPNPVAGMPAGTTAKVYYLMVAKDNDDADGDCDHVTTAPNDGTVFEMTVTSPGPSETCQDDLDEPDDDPDSARPTDFSPDPFFSDTNAICPGNDDWYRIELSDGQTLVVDLTFTQSTPDEDLDLHLLDASTTDLTPCCAGPGQSPNGPEHAEYTLDDSACTAAAPCTFFVVVHGYDGSANLYDLRMALQ
ncbi:MAG TPA: hypothetical protein VFG83_12805 [Kofleriaceae bacterium]|nr:hypothetical protein [Kofleriaceae bacterium]